MDPAGLCALDCPECSENLERMDSLRKLAAATGGFPVVSSNLFNDAFPPGRAYPMTQRRARLRSLTAWNDAPGRTEADVLDLIDRAISRTIVGAVAQSAGSR